ncbi:hypothetical protein [Geomesophilobacter sediminis]|uniref:Uncharacterized protein n=1 Tax=Geomesophilobacter sediminis TaxID=2798584 RepID=A0A8J7M2W7_9BACT|nr:hypothetical protein [Geomesophilobacter sediminis]MBJ6727648.1 hypothetical protein [Geomesophilobacter sediminis]
MKHGICLYRGPAVMLYSAPMETIKTALFETLMELAVPNAEGGYTFTLDGETFTIQDTLEITGIATKKGYIIIY